jgi:Zn-finger nucleic acid-binding protein
MEPVKYEGIEVDRCTGCQGMWFDALEDRELRAKKGSEKLDTGSGKTGARHDAKGKIRCPRDGAMMIRMVDRDQPHVWYESCSSCYGTFFDAGEFRDLKQRSIGDLFRRLRKGERPLT